MPETTPLVSNMKTGYRILDDRDMDDKEKTSEPVGHRRYVIAFLCLWVTTICYADRTNIGIALPAFVQDKKVQGAVMSSFFYGYLCTQIAGGYLATHFGAKRVLIVGVIVWTLFDLSTVLVADCRNCLYVARAGMGLGEGILFPCMHQISGAWYPLQERSFLVSIVTSGTDFGTILALVLSPALLESYGWERIFEVFGVLSFIWLGFYVILGGPRPELDTRITSAERHYILTNRTIDPETHRGAYPHPHPPNQHEKLPWKTLLTSRPAWAIYVAHFCFNYGWYVLLGWIPQYFRQELHIDMSKHIFSAALPYLCGYVGTMSAGKISDMMVARAWRVVHVRKIMNTAGFLGAAICLFSLKYAPSANFAVGLLCAALFMARLSMSGYWVNMIDVGPNHAAYVMGVSNTFATIPGIVGNVVTGDILESTGRWDLVFGIAAAVLVFGAAFFHCNASDKSIFSRSHGGTSTDGYTSLDMNDDVDGVNDDDALLER